MADSRILGLILAGGRARRLGGRDKALILLNKQPLIEHVIRRLQPQVDALALSSNAPEEGYAAYGLPVLPDRLPGYLGPLAGIHAGLAQYPDDSLATVAVDLPFLPSDLVRRLRAGLNERLCAYASDGTRHALALIWQPGAAPEVEAYLAGGGRSLKDFLATHGRAVLFDRPQDRGLFLNINTPEDLARAEVELSRPQMNADEHR
jgi:molybdopterin-guanine dinucleotide biosynthesis protein A